MKTSLRKLVATVSGLAIAAVLPMASMMASAEGETLAFTADKTTVAAGDTVKLSAVVDGLDRDAGSVWNVLEYNIAYDEAQVTPVQQDNGRDMVDYLPGDALYLMGGNAMVQVNLTKNPILVGAIDADGQYDNGEVMNIAFKVADSVAAGDKITLTVNVTQYAKAVIVDNKAQDPVDLVAPDSYTVELTVGGTEPTESQPTETEPTESQPTESTDTSATGTDTSATGTDTSATGTDTSASGTDTTASGSDTGVVTPGTSGDDVQPTLPSTDITVNGGSGSGTGATTGESTTLFVVALVLMAGSAAALVVMKKKKVFSK